MIRRKRLKCKYSYEYNHVSPCRIKYKKPTQMSTTINSNSANNRVKKIHACLDRFMR